jgi:hypothetical protein
MAGLLTGRTLVLTHRMPHKTAKAELQDFLNASGRDQLVDAGRAR